MAIFGHILERFVEKIAFLRDNPPPLWKLVNISKILGRK